MLDPAAREARLDGELLALTRREFELLEVLARNAGIVLTRDQLLDRVWGYDFEVRTDAVDTFVSYLRRKLESGGRARIIHTVRGVGFVLRADDGGRKHVKLSTRIALAVGVTVPVLVLAAGWVLLRLVARDLHAEQDAHLRERAAVAAGTPAGCCGPPPPTVPPRSSRPVSGSCTPPAWTSASG